MSNLDLLLEAERRGILPPEKRALLDEARSRGLVGGAGQMSAPPSENGGSRDVFAPLGLKEDSTGQLFFQPAPEPQPLHALDKALGTHMADSFVARTADAIVPDDPGGAIIGGLRNAVLGLGTLPLDVASVMGSEGSGKVADTIRKSVPEFRQPDTAGNIMQTVTQFAAPGMKGGEAGVNLVSKLPGMIEKAPTLMGKFGQLLAKGLGGMTGAAAADAAVTDPNQASTLGDLFNAGPTAIQPDDSALTKRIKVGAETFAVEPAAQAVAGAAKLIGKGAKVVGRTIEPFTEKGQERIAREYIQSQATDPQAAAAGIDKTLRSIDQSEGFMPLAGEASNDPGLIAAQRAVMNTTKRGTGTAEAPGEQILARSVKNQEAVAKQFENLTAPSKTGDPQAMKGAAQAEQAAMLAEPQKAVSDVQASIAKLQSDMETQAADLAANKGRKTAASEAIDSQIRTLEQDMMATKNKLFQQVDPQGTLRAPADDLIEQLDAIENRPVQGVANHPSTLIGDIKTAAEAADNSLSFRDLIDLRSRVSDEIATARANQQGVLVNKLVKVKEAVNGKIDGFAEALGPDGAEAATKLREAQDFYANEFAPRFKQGQGGKLRLEQKSGRPGAAPPSATAGKFLDAGVGAPERAQDLARLIGADNPNAREYLISDLADKVTDGKMVNGSKLDRWLETHRDTLAANPTLRQEVVQMKNRLSAGSKVKGQLEADLEAATGNLKLTEEQVKQNAAKLFLDNGEPLDAVSKIMSGTNIERKMRQAVAAAKRDTSGAALDGLKDTVKLWARKNMTQAAETLGGRPLVSSAKMNQATKNPGLVKALDILYADDPQALRSLRQIRNNLNVLSRPQRVQGTAGSSTEPIRQQAGELRTVLASAVGITQGRGYFQIGKWIENLTGMNPQPLIEQLVTDAMLDPKLAKTMLLSAEPKNVPKIEKGLRTYITNNLLGEDERRKEANRKGK